VQQRTEFKLAVSVNKTLNGLSSQWQADDYQLTTTTSHRQL